MQTQKLKVNYLTPDNKITVKFEQDELIGLLQIIERCNEMTHEMLTDKKNVDTEWKELLTEDLKNGVFLYNKIMRAGAIMGLEKE